MADTYVDLYLLPVPTEKLDAYREQAARFGAVARERGALSYREFLGDDLGDGLAAQAGMTLTTEVAEFESRAHRDEVMGRVMDDPRVKAQMEEEPAADMDQMRYGGFAPFVTA